EGGGAAAGGVFEALCESADAAGDAERAMATAERLVALDPTRENRQRVALRICARYRGREAALDQARLLTNLLRSELAVSPEPATRALVDAIRRGEVDPAPVRQTLPAPAADDADDALPAAPAVAPLGHARPPPLPAAP